MKKTIPYAPVDATCNELVVLAQGICQAATAEISNGGSYELFLIRNAANRIGLLADHLVDYDCQGLEHWLALPEIENVEDQSD